MMRIIIDLQGAQTESKYRGIGRYSLSITKAILRNNKTHEFFVLLNANFIDTIPEIKEALLGLIPEEKIIVCKLPAPLKACDGGNEWRRAAASLIREEMIRSFSADIVFITSLFEGHIDDAIITIKSLRSKTKVFVLHHDLIPLVNEKTYLQDQRFRSYYLNKIDNLKKADVILTNSDYTAKEAKIHLADTQAHIASISSATEEEWHDKNIKDIDFNYIKNKFSITKDIILYAPGGFDKRKNFERLIFAFSQINSDLRYNKQLVIVSKLNDGDRIYLTNIIKNAGLTKKDVILTGYVSDDELILFYRHCFLFVFASEHEGFGLPILEAMKCGAATIGSNVTSIPEVIGLEKALFDPFSVEAIKNKIIEVIVDEEFREKLKSHAISQSAKFSWDLTAQKALNEFSRSIESLSLDETHDDENEPLTIIEKLIKIDTKVRPSQQDLMKVAEALDRNMKLAEIMQALEKRLEWRIDGPFDSSYSLALVNRQFARALNDEDTDVLLHSTEGPGDYEPDATFMHKSSNADLLTWNRKAQQSLTKKSSIQSRNIYPPRVTGLNANVKLLHCYAWEETGYPLEWIQSFNNELDAVLCTSHHVKKILLDNGLRLPAFVTGNGCDHWESINSIHYDLGKVNSFRFLHVSSCFPRKGADAMLQAYGKAFKHSDDVTLIIKTFHNPHNTIKQKLDALKKDNANFPHVIIIEEDLDESLLKSIYEQCDVLVAPSCAEGFGLPIAEAMLSGLPAIVTNWSGQKDFCDATNSWLVDYTYAHAKTHFSLYSSAWVDVSIDDLALKMKCAFDTPLEDRRQMAEKGRSRILSNFSWSSVAKRSIASLKALQANFWECNQQAKIGWITTWNTKCGIATYSQHLVNNMPGQYSMIFSPNGQETIDKQNDKSIRTWRIGKEENNLNVIVKHIEQAQLNTVIIQFNYGFFNHSELSAFILELKEKNVIVIMTLHSTVDPDKSPVENFKLLHILDALRVCDRLLVHSFADLNRLKELGLEDNVTLFPHGVLSNDTAQTKSHVTEGIPLIASYGFCLPHKGLMEIVQAIKILRDNNTPVKIRLVNAEFPVAESHDLVNALKEFVIEQRLSDLVEFHNDFLADEHSLRLLSDADLLLFAYQNTGESASGAVRYGMATAKPVIVTPIPIFDDLGDAVFKFEGFTADIIAKNIMETLKDIASNSENSLKVKAAADAWRAQHDYQSIGLRLDNLCSGLVRNLTIKDECQ